MPTAEDLAQLKTLLNQLLPIAQTRPGELIRAEDWNTLVSAIMGLARSLLEREEARQVPPHDHLDQVTTDWLVPALRDQLQRGPLADPAMQARLLTIEQQLRGLLKQLDDHRQDLGGVRGRLTDIATRDIVREAAVTDVSRKVAGLGDARADVLEVRKSLGTVQNDMGTVLQAARRLEVDGQTVDVGALVGRVGALEGFRQSFTSAGGQVLDASAIEQRLAENRNQFVTQTQLDDAFKNRPLVLSADVIAGFEDRLGTTLRAQVNASFDTFAATLRAETRGSLNGVGDLIANRLNDAMPGVTQSLTTTLTASIDRARQDAVAAAVKQASENTSVREKAIRADLDQIGLDIRASLSTAVREGVAQVLPGELSGIRSEISTLNARADLLSTRGGTVEATLTRQGDALALLQQDAGRQRLEMRELLQNEIKLAADGISRDVASLFQANRADLKTQFEALSKDVRTTAIDGAKAAAVEAAQAETRSVRTQILAEMRQVAKEEAGIAVRDQIRPTTGGTVISGGVVRPLVTDVNITR